MRKATLVLLFFFPAMTWAQDTGIQFWLGVGTFAMDSQKELQNDFLESGMLPVGLEAVHSFDPYWTWGLGYTINLNSRSAIGVWYEQASTGGRLSYKDYSGSYRLDQVLSCWQLGLSYQYQVNHSSRWPLFATLQMGYVSTTEDFTSELVLGSNSVSDDFTLNASNLSFRPGLMLQPKVSIFTFQVALGYELHTNATLQSDSVSINTQSGEPLQVDWSGVRFHVGILLPIRFRKPSAEVKP
jgi:hypothetical protein